MAQRTFNEINTSPTVFDEEDMEIMNVQPVQKGKRGRKRHSDEESLTEAERQKKEKNRKAAQKCREKKEKEAKDLKMRNDELERENKKLSDEKKKLQMRADEFCRIIHIHIQKGCKLPPNVQEVYNEGQLIIPASGCSGDVELYRAVGTIERDHTPPHTPEEPSSGNLSPHIRHQPHNFTGAPTALFSGTPLTEDEVTRRKSGSISRSPSPSPALPLSPAKTVPHLPGRQKDLSYFLAHNQVPKALAPISASRVDSNEGFSSWFPPQSQQTVPTVVTDIEDDCEETTGYMSQTYPIIEKDKTMFMTIPSSSVMEVAFQLPDVPSEDEIAKQLARQDQTTHGDESKQHLSSLGFNCIAGYSYTEDLQKIESVEEIIHYSDDVQPDNSQPVSNRKQNSSLSRTESSQTQPIVNVSVCAPALLGIGLEMSASLQEQIKTSYISPTNSTLGTISLPGITQPNPNKNQQNVLTQSGHELTQSGHVLTQSGHVLTQSRHVLTQASLTNQSSSTATQPQNDQQKLLNILESLKEARIIATGHDGQPSDISSEQIQEILKSWLMKNLTAQNQTFDQPMEVSQDVPNVESHLLSQKITSLGLPKGASIVRQASEELTVQQGNGDQLSAGSMATRFSPVRGSLPAVNVASPSHLQTLNPISPQLPDIPGSSSYLASREATDLPVTTEHHYNSRRYIYINRQVIELPSSTAQVPANSSALVSETTDYSESLQDLPSLNLTELNSDNNLFEKKPSRLT